jgi:hypothetical protein
MEKISTAVIAVFLFLGIASASYAIRDQSSLGKQDTLVVINPEGEAIGTIEGALQDPLGKVAFVVVKLDEENGRKDIVVPLTAFSAGGEKGAVVLDIDKDMLASAPEFDASKLEDPTYAGNLYKFYGETPPWSE